jgi:hypothetical protein
MKASLGEVFFLVLKENENIHHSHSIGIVPGHPWLRAKNETTAERKATFCG